MPLRKERRFRVSCFAVGAQLHDAPLKHFAPKTRERADLVFLREKMRIAKGAHAFVVMHQGNLRRAAFVILKRADQWTRADELTRMETSFDDFDALLDAGGGYRPSLDTTHPRRAELADLYDEAQKARRDNRRAHRWQSPAEPR